MNDILTFREEKKNVQSECVNYYRLELSVSRAFVFYYVEIASMISLSGHHILAL